MDTRSPGNPKIQPKSRCFVLIPKHISHKRQETGLDGTPEALEATAGSAIARRSPEWPPEAWEIPNILPQTDFYFCPQKHNIMFPGFDGHLRSLSALKGALLVLSSC